MKIFVGLCRVIGVLLVGLSFIPIPFLPGELGKPISIIWIFGLLGVIELAGLLVKRGFKTDFLPWVFIALYVFIILFIRTAFL